MTESPAAQLRDARPADVPRVVELMRGLYGSLPDGAFDAVERERAVHRLLDQPAQGRLWVVDAEGSVAGYLVLGFAFSLEFGGRHAWVDELYLAPSARGAGLASAMLDHAERFCRADGISAVRLEVTHANHHAQAIYRRRGFVAHPRHIMTRWLDNLGGERA